MTNLKTIPFTYHWIVRRAIGSDVKTVLDLGCGEGDFMRAISHGESWRVTGVELFKDAFIKAEKSRVYQKVSKGDVTDLPKEIKNQKYDVVFSSQVLEHLSKKKGQAALMKWEKLAVKRVVITTPVGFIDYEPIGVKAEDKNPYQKHFSGWNIEALRKLGYKVRGQGARLIYGQNGLARKLPQLLTFWQILSYLISPIVYFWPNLATYMVAAKEVK
jgi:phospholipid N-methyltransferase